MTFTLMVQGTTSDAGKSILVAGLCRVLARKTMAVVPFKPQNMALNSAVTSDGGEIGRAQALQAEACYLEPHTDMNPILLKPSSDTGAQVIVHGKAISHLDAVAYHDYKKVAMAAVLESHQRISAQYDVIVVEGAGSPAEINLRANDIANMGFAEAVDCPVILIADIDRGGVFAHLVGTLALLSPSEQKRVVGFVINKFRGDLSLLQPGVEWLENYTKKPVLGVLPYIQGLHLDAEDAINVEQVLDQDLPHLKVVVPVFPRISNHTDFDVLRLHPQVKLQFVGPGMAAPNADLIVLPGSKNVRKDLAWLRENGWDTAIKKHLRYGGKVMGICGGFQMLGKLINDPHGVEDAVGGSSTGLGLLDISTTLQIEKQLRKVTGKLLSEDFSDQFFGQAIVGYEIHCGTTEGAGLSSNLITLSDGRQEGAISEDGQVLGTYLHGIFDQPEGLNAILAWAGLSNVQRVDAQKRRDQELDRLADVLEQNVELSAIFPMLKTGVAA